MIAGFRKQLHAPNALVIAGETCRVPESENTPYTMERHTVTKQTKQAIAKINNAAFVTSEGLVGHDGNTHFDTESIREFGVRYGKAYLQLLKAKSVD